MPLMTLESYAALSHLAERERRFNEVIEPLIRYTGIEYFVKAVDTHIGRRRTI